jgi:hypothetical protein
MERATMVVLLALAAAPGHGLTQEMPIAATGTAIGTPVNADDYPRYEYLKETLAGPVLISPEPARAYFWNNQQYFDVDYLLWWVQKLRVPPLVTTGSSADAVPGALGQPGTQVLLGDRSIGFGAFNGIRLDLGVWVDRDRNCGLEAAGFILEHRSAQFDAQGDANGQPFLAAPFVNALTGQNSVYLLSQNFPPPGPAALVTGGVSVQNALNLSNWEVHAVANLARDEAGYTNLLIGFRQTLLREDMSYGTSMSNIDVGGAAMFLNTPVTPGSIVTTFDSFSTKNTFNGPQVGIRFDRRWGPVTVNLISKLAMGAVHQVVTIQGASATNDPSFAVSQGVGGIYAQTSNIGSFSRDAFAVIPEVGINVGAELTQHLRIRAGYSFLYVSNVVRPGDQIDPRINPNLVPIDPTFGTAGGPNLPAFSFRSTGFWVQGVNFGVEITF